MHGLGLSFDDLLAMGRQEAGYQPANVFTSLEAAASNGFTLTAKQMDAFTEWNVERSGQLQFAFVQAHGAISVCDTLTGALLIF
jgi:hypothetical protein